jgi:Flp pilus assembly protein TadD
VVDLALSAWDDAVSRFERALSGDCDNAEAWFNLGWAQRRAGRVAEAAAPLRQALRLRPDWSAAWFNLGNLLLDDLDDRSRPPEWCSSVCLGMTT